MRIFYVCYSDLNRQTAWRTHTMEVAERLARRGHKLTLFAPSGWTPSSYSYTNKTNLNIVSVPVLPGKFISFISFQFFLLLKMFLLGRKGKVDIVYVREYFLLYTTLVAANIMGARHVVEVNSIMTDILERLGANRLKIALTRVVQRRILDKSYRVIVVTNGMKQRLEELYQLPDNKVVVIANGANTDMFKPLEKAFSADKVGLPHKPVYIGFVGLIYPWRMIRYLLAVFKQVTADADEDIKLLIVGDGGELLALKDRVYELGLNDAVVFTGEAPYESIPYYINLIDVPVIFWDTDYKSDHGSPVKLYEYLVCGRSIVTNEGSSYADFVRQYDAGIVVDGNDEQTAADSLKMYIKAKKYKCDAERERIRDVAVGNFSWDRTVSELERVLQI